MCLTSSETILSMRNGFKFLNKSKAIWKLSTVVCISTQFRVKESFKTLLASLAVVHTDAFYLQRFLTECLNQEKKQLFSIKYSQDLRCFTLQYRNTHRNNKKRDKRKKNTSNESTDAYNATRQLRECIASRTTRRCHAIFSSLCVTVPSPASPRRSLHVGYIRLLVWIPVRKV